MTSKQLRTIGIAIAALAMLAPYSLMVGMWIGILPPSPQGGNGFSYAMVGVIAVLMSLSFMACYKARKIA